VHEAADVHPKHGEVQRVHLGGEGKDPSGQIVHVGREQFNTHLFPESENPSIQLKQLVLLLLHVRQGD
jgi:hypothetical protein